LGQVLCVDAVFGGHGGVQPGFVAGEDVRVACASDEDELGGEGADSGELLEGGEGRVGGHGAEAGGVGGAWGGGFGEGVEAFDLRVGQAGHVVDGQEGGRGGEGVQGSARDVDGFAVFFGQAGLDGGGLRHADAVADDRPGGGFVGGVEADRTESRVV